MKKTYQNYSISPRENSTWWNVFKDDQFLNTVRDEEAARQIIWNGTGKGEHITDKMMMITSSFDFEAPKGTNVMVDILLSVEYEAGFENFMDGSAEVFNMNGITSNDEGEMCTEILKNGELEICQYIAGVKHSYIVPKGQWKIKQGEQL